MARLHLASAHLADPGRSRGALTLAWTWLLLPILGKLAALLFLVLMPLLRDRDGSASASLRTLLGLSWIYALYIVSRAALAGPGMLEPLLDVIPLVCATTIAFLTVRGPLRLDPVWLFKATTVVLIAIFGLALLERMVLGIWRPQLLTGNPLNLTSILLVPALFVTMDRFAPDRLWAWLGLLAFGLTAFVIGGLSQSRGLFVGLGGLLLVRVVFVLAADGPRAARVAKAAQLAAVAAAVAFIVASNPLLSNRYVAMSSTLSQGSQVGEWSTGVRLAMLEGGLAAAAERPIIGHGPQFRSAAIHPYVAEQFRLDLSHLHNDFLTHMVAGGIPALVLLVLMICCPGWYGWRGSDGLPRNVAFVRREIGTLVTLSLAGVAAVNNLFFVDISAFTTAMTLTMTLVILESLHETSEPTND